MQGNKETHIVRLGTAVYFRQLQPSFIEDCLKLRRRPFRSPKCQHHQIHPTRLRIGPDLRDQELVDHETRLRRHDSSYVLQDADGDVIGPVVQDPAEEVDQSALKRLLLVEIKGEKKKEIQDEVEKKGDVRTFDRLRVKEIVHHPLNTLPKLAPSILNRPLQILHYNPSLHTVQLLPNHSRSMASTAANIYHQSRCRVLFRRGHQITLQRFFPGKEFDGQRTALR